MGLWDTVKSAFEQDRQYFTYFRVPPQQVMDRPSKAQPLVAGLHYFRVWLPAMYLGKRVSWFQTLFPAVHSIVTANFAEQQNVSIPTLADPIRLGFHAAGSQGEVIARNFPLTPLLPFGGGTVTVQCGLIALDGYNYLSGFLKTLSNFAGLLAVPQISTALSVAEPLMNGMQELFGAGNGKLHLGLMETFTAESLQEGYIAVVRATTAELDPSRIVVSRELLWQVDGAGQLQPLPFDHLLLRIEVKTTRDDWETFPSISKPYKDCVDALAEQDESRAHEHLRAAVLAAFKAPELTQAQRRVVVDELRRRYATARESLLIQAVAPRMRGIEMPSAPAAGLSFDMEAPEAVEAEASAPIATRGMEAPTVDAEVDAETLAFEKGPLDFHEVFDNLHTI